MILIKSFFEDEKYKVVNIESLQTTVESQHMFLVVTLVLAHIKYLLELINA